MVLNFLLLGYFEINLSGSLSKKKIRIKGPIKSHHNLEEKNRP